MKLAFIVISLFFSSFSLQAQLATHTLPLCTKVKDNSDVQIVAEAKSRELNFANGYVPLIVKLTFGNSGRLNHSIMVVYPDKADTITVHSMRFNGWKGFSIPLPFLLSFPSKPLPYFYQKVKVLFKNNSTQQIDAGANVYVYFTPYRTTEVWNETDFNNLPRVWSTPTTIAPPKSFFPRKDFPVSDLTLAELVNDSIPKSYISIDGLAYTIAVRKRLDPDRQELPEDFEDDAPPSNGKTAAVMGLFGKKESNWRTWKGTVSGRLVTNVNGVDIPITGIRVTIMQQDKFVAPCFGVDDELATVQTDNDGFFRANISAEYRIKGGVFECFREGDALELYVAVESRTNDNTIRVEKRSGAVRKCNIRDNNIYNWNYQNLNPDMGTMHVDKDIKPQLLHWAYQSRRFVFEQGQVILPPSPLVICITPQLFGRDNAFFLPGGVRNQIVAGNFFLPVASAIAPVSEGYWLLNFTNNDGLYIGEEYDQDEETTQHEFGHYLMYHLQKQSWLSPLKAGFVSHYYNANAETINVAWTEGWADGFSFIMDGYCQKYDGESGTERGYNFEERRISGDRPENKFYPIKNREIGPTVTHGFASEFNIGAFLFDLFDGRDNNQLNGGNGRDFADISLFRRLPQLRANDRVELTFRQICQPLLNKQGTGGYINQGGNVINHIQEYHYQLIKDMDCASRGRITQLGHYNGLTSFENITQNFTENPIPLQSLNSDILDKGGMVTYDKFKYASDQWQADGNASFAFQSGLNIGLLEGQAQSYNLGGTGANERIAISDALAVGRDATLYLNAPNRSLYPALGLPAKGSWLQADLCGENELRLMDNGVLELGGATDGNATQLVVSDFAVLVAEDSTTINLHSRSIIWVKAGGTLYIRAGARLNLGDQSQLLVDAGGFICIENGAIVTVAPETTIMIDGAANKGVRNNLGIIANNCGGRYVPGYRKVARCPNEALTFDGLDDYIAIPDNSSINFGTSDFTVEAFVKPMPQLVPQTNLYIASKVLFSNQGPNSTGFGLLIDPNGGLYGWTMNSTHTSYVHFTSANDAHLIDGKCHYVAFQRQGGNYRLFVDGYSVNTANAAPSNMPDNVSSSNNIFIGSSNPQDNYTQPFHGWIGEFRLWNYARTSTQIASSKASLQGSLDGLVAWYDMNDYDQTLTDLSPLGNTAQMGSSPDADIHDPTWLGKCEVDCSVENNFRKGVATSEEASKTPQMTIMPNPTTNTAYVYCTEKIKEATLMTVQGQILEKILYSNPHQEIKLGDRLPSGMYHLQVVTESGTYIMEKLIKQ